MNIADVEFVRSAAGAPDLPGAERPQVALVGRSNVGKSSLINALGRRRVARTSDAPGKTRLVNFYRVRLATGARAPRVLYLADLPGYGYARGNPSGRAFEQLAATYFDKAAGPASGQPSLAGVLLVVDARHPGLPQDLRASEWLAARGVDTIVVGTKIDCLTRTARVRAERELTTRFTLPVVAVSAHTGEGLNRLWTLIIKLVTRQEP